MKWGGNCYRRDLELPKQLAKLDPKELAEFGRNKTNRDFMRDYNSEKPRQKDATFKKRKGVDICQNIMLPFGKGRTFL